MQPCSAVWRAFSDANLEGVSILERMTSRAVLHIKMVCGSCSVSALQVSAFDYGWNIRHRTLGCPVSASVYILPWPLSSHESGVHCQSRMQNPEFGGLMPHELPEGCALMHAT